MGKKVLAVAGTALVWLPVVFMVITGVAGSIQAGRLLVDYLIPLELFWMVFLGSGLLLWSAILAHRRQRLFGWGLGLIVCLLVLSQVIAMLTGLASGEHEAEGWRMVIMVGLIASYLLSIAVVGGGGIMLSRELLRREQ